MFKKTLAVIALTAALAGAPTYAAEVDAKVVFTAGQGFKEVNDFLGFVSHSVELFVPDRIAVGQTIALYERSGVKRQDVRVNRITVNPRHLVCWINPSGPGLFGMTPGDKSQTIAIQPCDVKPL